MLLYPVPQTKRVVDLCSACRRRYIIGQRSTLPDQRDCARISVRHGIMPVPASQTAPRIASHQAAQRKHSPTYQAVAGNGLIGIFGTGRHKSAAIADKPRQGELIEAHQTNPQHPSWRLGPRATIISRITRAGFGLAVHSVRRLVFVDPGLLPLPRPRHQRPAWLTHGGPDSHEPAPGTAALQTCRQEVGRPP